MKERRGAERKREKKKEANMQTCCTKSICFEDGGRKKYIYTLHAKLLLAIMHCCNKLGPSSSQNIFHLLNLIYLIRAHTVPAGITGRTWQ